MKRASDGWLGIHSAEILYHFNMLHIMSARAFVPTSSQPMLIFSYGTFKVRSLVP